MPGVLEITCQLLEDFLCWCFLDLQVGHYHVRTEVIEDSECFWEKRCPDSLVTMRIQRQDQIVHIVRERRDDQVLFSLTHHALLSVWRMLLNKFDQRRHERLIGFHDEGHVERLQNRDDDRTEFRFGRSEDGERQIPALRLHTTQVEENFARPGVDIPLFAPRHRVEVRTSRNYCYGGFPLKNSSQGFTKRVTDLARHVS